MIGSTLAVVVLLASGTLALGVGRYPRLATGCATTGAVVAAALGLPSALAVLRGASVADLRIEWVAPIGEVRFGLDPLAAFFMVPTLLLGAAFAVYGAFYLDEKRERHALGPQVFFFNALVAAMLLVLLARHAIVFLVAWELMTLAGYLLVTFEHDQVEVRRAGWVYLIAAHIGVACLIALFLLLGHHSGSFGFAEIAAHPLSGPAAIVASLLAFLGFGLKAGVVPLHVWLPEAHAVAPSHVSALMSGVLIKLGIYGLLRTLTFLGPQTWWGPVLATLGILGALTGISLALYQRDLKRALAYSSIENIGIILLGLGVGLWGLAQGHAEVAALGLYGGLLHVWNHALMKGLLFLGAGSLLHATGTRDLEQMGGVLQRMPWTGSLTIIGAVAIVGLPPFNGFASEWLVYLGLVGEGIAHRTNAGLVFVFAIAALGTVGVLAAVCFVRLIGIALLGEPRSRPAACAHESGAGILGPIAALAVGVIVFPYLAPLLVVEFEPLVEQVAAATLTSGAAATALHPITVVSLVLWLACAAVFAALGALTRQRRKQETWACGYAAPTARMQYTSNSFSEQAVTRLLPRPLRARIVVESRAQAFPAPGRLSSDRHDPFTRIAYEPFIDRLAQSFAQLRWVQQGILHLYLLYILIALVAGLTLVSIEDWWTGP